jgi:glutathione S-transferase
LFNHPRKVPVLVYQGNKPIAESQVVLEFIDEAWKDRGDAILPEDPYERAMARFWARFLRDKVLKSTTSFLFVTSELFIATSNQYSHSPVGCIFSLRRNHEYICIFFQLSPPIWKWFTTQGREQEDAHDEAAMEQLLVLEKGA